MEKPEFIKNVEANSEIFSMIVLPSFDESYFEVIQRMNLNVVFEKLKFSDNKYIYEYQIYETPQKFYLVFEKDNQVWNTTIYYKPKQFKELKFFINNLYKHFKNATNNN